MRDTESGSPWGCFFKSLRRMPCSSMDWAKPADSYSTPDGKVYLLGPDSVGAGSYGAVHQYVGPPGATPETFCVKTIKDTAHEEVAAFRCLQRVGAADLVVEGALLRTWCMHNRSCAEVGMRLYDMTLHPFTLGGTSMAQAMQLCMLTSAAVGSLWARDMAYCDIKSTNVLCNIDAFGDVTRLVLGDVGGMVDISKSSCDPLGLFSFPPQRAFRSATRQESDGVVEPREGDLVWGLGMLLASLVWGGAWVNSRFSAANIRLAAKKRACTLEEVFETLAAEIRDKMLDDSDRTWHAAMHVAIDAWEEKGVSIESFKVALQVQRPKRRRTSMVLPTTPPRSESRKTV